ncbi:DUF5518 domain-containing protein [Haloferax sp. DFSO60]|uniref:DUF5518 domain-containing protein n=1 Tax=Haloferax sp. DFSO60 TaxID=3388652 RepID=UPI0039799E8D
MSRGTRFLGRFDPAWKYALVGGLLSIPFSLGEYWLSGMGTNYPAGMLVVGAGITGYLAQRGGVDTAKSGLGAGFIGGLPVYLALFPPLIQSFAAWPSPLGVIVLPCLVVGIVALLTVLGGIAGLVGGWVAKKVGVLQRRAVHS